MGAWLFSLRALLNPTEMETQAAVGCPEAGLGVRLALQLWKSSLLPCRMDPEERALPLLQGAPCAGLWKGWRGSGGAPPARAVLARVAVRHKVQQPLPSPARKRHKVVSQECFGSKETLPGPRTPCGAADVRWGGSAFGFGAPSREFFK